MKRRNVSIITLLTLWLLFSLPAALHARPRPHMARARQHASQTKPSEHPHRKAKQDTKPHAHDAAAPLPERHRSKLLRPVSVARIHGKLPPATFHPMVPASSRAGALAIPSVVVRSAYDAAEAGKSHPSDLHDIDDTPASVPVPVVSVIRKTTERPQLPSVEEVASTPAILPSLYDERGHLMVPQPLRGSHEILVHQNAMADRDGLARVRDDDDLAAMRRRTMLVALPVNQEIHIDERLPYTRRFCRPWTAQFLVALANAHYARFHTPLQVNSAVRTVAFQQRLLRTNGNAAPAAGDTASPHLTGQAVDLAKRGLSLSEIAWMRGYLLPLMEAGTIDVEEEFQQACFHISVYKTYLGAAAPPRAIAVTHRDSPAVAAIALQ